MQQLTSFAQSGGTSGLEGSPGGSDAVRAAAVGGVDARLHVPFPPPGGTPEEPRTQRRGPSVQAAAVAGDIAVARWKRWVSRTACVIHVRPLKHPSSFFCHTEGAWQPSCSFLPMLGPSLQVCFHIYVPS